MPIKKILHDSDFDLNRLLNARLQPVTTAERNAMSSTLNPSSDGLIVYDKDLQVFYGWNGNAWFALNMSGASLAQFQLAVDNMVIGVSVTGGAEKTITIDRNIGVDLTATFLDGYVYDQSIPAQVWVINHPLEKRPSVTVVDSAGTTVYGDVNYNSNSQIQLSFSAPFSGKAYLN